MSKPTIIMITRAADDDGIERLNASLIDRLGISGRLTRVDPIAAAWDVATAVHIGSFNHLDEPLFMQLVGDAAWRQPGRLQVYIEREDDTKFTEYDLFDELEPRRIALGANSRGVALPAPPSQVEFFERLRGVVDGPTRKSEADAVEMETPWFFEVVAIQPSYFFESNARLVPCGNTSAIGTDGSCVAPVDLAFDGVGVRWGSRRTDVLDYADKTVRAAIDALNPGDRVRIEGKVRSGPHGIAELSDVRSIETLT